MMIGALMLYAIDNNFPDVIASGIQDINLILSGAGIETLRQYCIRLLHV